MARDGLSRNYIRKFGFSGSQPVITDKCMVIIKISKKIVIPVSVIN